MTLKSLLLPGVENNVYKIKLMNRVACIKRFQSPVRNVRLHSKTHHTTFALSSPQVFGFLASFMFLFDFASMVWEKQQESQMRKPEATRRTEATEPLNA